MTNTNITQARKDLFKLAESCLQYNDIININTKNGNIVLLSEEDYRGMTESLYLSNIPGLVATIQKERNSNIEDFEEFKWDD